MKGMNSKEKERQYTIIKPIGSGSFGTVSLAQYNDTGQKIAVKRVFQDQRYKNRELEIIKEINHPNVVKLLSYSYDPCEKENSDDYYLNIVMEFIPDTLAKVVKNYTKQGNQMPYTDVRIYAFQMLRSIVYCNAAGVCHRDIKPHNILIDTDTKILKLIDFGSAKKLQKGDTNIAYICSRYYRAPELSFGATDYTTAIDTWSVGCCIAELVLGKPIFQGESNVDQVVEVMKILGTPTKQQIKMMNSNYTNYRFPFIKSFPFSSVFKKAKDLPEEYLDLLRQLLCYEPEKRLKPIDALKHPFFDELKDEDIFTKLPKDFDLEFLFGFTEKEKKEYPSQIKEIIPVWYSTKSNN